MFSDPLSLFLILTSLTLSLFCLGFRGTFFGIRFRGRLRGTRRGRLRGRRRGTLRGRRRGTLRGRFGLTFRLTFRGRFGLRFRGTLRGTFGTAPVEGRAPRW